MFLMQGYRFYCQYPIPPYQGGSKAPGYLVKVEKIEDVLEIEDLAEFPSMRKVTISLGGRQLVIDGNFFIEPTKDGWALADAFDRLGWSQRRRIGWCNRVFPLKSGQIAELEKNHTCATQSWSDLQYKIAVGRIQKIVRKVRKVDSPFKHPLNKTA